MNQPIKILLAEDELALGTIVKESLETKGFEVIHCEDGVTALAQYKLAAPEALVLDVMMPKKDGFTLAKEIRAINTQVPIIFLTSKSQTKDVVEGFESGGNDYLKKPFSMEELIVRLNSLLQRKQLQAAQHDIYIGAYTFQFKKQTLQYKDEAVVSLTHREAHLLFHLNNTKNEVLNRSVILKKLWNNDDFFCARSMDVFISKLRKKLSKDETIQIINVRGYGYKLVY
ncbi:MAG TPA: response regulator transcription factor [Flavobacteriaceae bacterium]|nr:response regulator transcription factor [Flavobacteriaceae bacterium]HIO00296.1 response regulator transcription factor [Flavobacteriaceae bacterium]